MDEQTLTISPETRETMLFAQLDQAMNTMASTAEAMLDLRDISSRNENRPRIVGDLHGWIKSAREDLAAVEALLDGEAI